MEFRLLRVDLATGSFQRDSVPETLVHDYLGGSALAARLLYAGLTADLEPLAPEAPLLFMTGTLTGTAGTAVSRSVICGKSPATGIWAESNVGGFFGAEMRKAGFDGLWVTGKASRPVYLSIHNGNAEIKAADHLWGGADAYETQERIREELGDAKVRVATIGLGGESGIPFALVLCDHGRMAGRTGLGAVMGAKNLKAVAVRGSEAIPLADPKGFAAARRAANIALRDETQTKVLRTSGTGAAAEYFDYMGMVPKRYYTSGEPGGVEQVSGSAMAESILSGVSACHGCVVACGRKVRLEDGTERKGPEY